MPRRAIFWTSVVGFAALSLGMSLYAWRIVGDVRRDAALNDARLRSLAWSVLAYADAHGGFPLSADELRGFAAPDALAAAEGPGFPATRAATAYDAATPAPTPPPTLDECLSTIDVEWGLARDVQPILRPKGKPTLQGTRATVGQWLEAMSRRIRAG